MIETFSKNGVFGIKSSDIKVVFKNPSIQAFDENGYIKNEKDILYYYYDVIGSVLDNNKKRVVFESNVFDFPGIVDFKYMLEEIINKNINDGEYQKDKSKDGRISYYTYSLNNGCFVEDYYSVSHQRIMEGNSICRDFYNVFFGKALDCTGNNCFGVAFNNLSEEEIKKIYEVVSEFISYSIKTENKSIIKRNKENISEWLVKDNKLYNIRNNGECINDIYPIDTKIDDLVVLVGDINSENFYSNNYHNCTIEEIRSDRIIISGGFLQKEGNYEKFDKEEIMLNTLLYIHENVPEHKLKYNEKEIFDDFLSVLSECEIEEFKIQSEEFLFNKWKEAIINRTWMCRDEHNLPKRIKDNGRHENVYASVKEIISNIKNSKKS